MVISKKQDLTAFPDESYWVWITEGEKLKTWKHALTQNQNEML